MESGISIAVFPPTLAPDSGEGPADIARGLACFLERRLRLLPNVVAHLQQLVYSTAQEPDIRRWLPTPRLWTVDEATALPVPAEFEATHILQGILDSNGTKTNLVIELVDLQVHEVAFRREIRTTNDSLLESFFPLLKDLAALLVPETGHEEVLNLVSAPPTHSPKAFSLFLQGLSGTLARRLRVTIPEPTAAFQQFLEAIEEDPTFEEAANALNGLARGWILNNDGSRDVAIAALEHAAHMFQNNLGIKETLGHAYFEGGRHIQARQYLREFAQQDHSPRAADALVRLADIEHHAGHPDKALELLHTALRREPEHIAALERLALHHMEGKRLSEAEQAWRRILEVAPTYPVALSRLAEVHLARGQLAKAAILYERSVQGDNPSPDVYFRCVRFFIDRNDFPRADTLATEWVETQPDQFRAWLTLSGIRGRLGQKDASAHALAKAAELAHTPRHRVELSSLRFAMENPKDARLFEKLLEAENLTRTVSPEEMLARRDASLTLCHNHPQVVPLWHLQVRLCQRVADLPGAIQAQRHIVDLVPEDASLHTALGQFLTQTANHTEAVTAFAAALARDPNNTQILTHLATAQLELGDLDSARSTATTALANAPDNPTLLKLIDRLSAREASEPSAPEKPISFLRRLLNLFRP